MFSRNSNERRSFNKISPGLDFSPSDFVDVEPVLWRLHPMHEVHRETLDREMEYIAFHVKPRPIVSRLYRDGILTSMDYNQLSRTEGQGEKAVTRLLIKTLQRRGEKAYPALINALLANDYSFVCERLADSELHLKQGMHADKARFSWRMDVPNDTPRGMPPQYSAMNGIYMNPTAFPFHSSSHTLQGEVTWPQPASYSSSRDHVTPLYSSLPPDGPFWGSADRFVAADYNVTGSNRFEVRLGDIDGRLRILHEDLSSLRNAYQSTPHNHVTSPTSRTRQGATVTDGQVINANFVEQELANVHAKLAQLLDFIAALKAEKFTANSSPGGAELGRVTRSSQVSPVNNEVNATSVAYHPHLEDQVNRLQNQFKDLHEDVLMLQNADRLSNQDTVTAAQDRAYEQQLAKTEELDRHLQALRREIDMLHEDVSMLKVARATSSRADTSNNGASEASYRTHMKEETQPSVTARTRHDSSYSDVTQISVSQTPYTKSYTRYPSRYSPVDGKKARDSDFGRSPLLSDRLDLRRSPSRSDRHKENKKTGSSLSLMKPTEKKSESVKKERSVLKENNDKSHPVKDDFTDQNLHSVKDDFTDQNPHPMKDDFTDKKANSDIPDKNPQLMKDDVTDKNTYPMKEDVTDKNPHAMKEDVIGKNPHSMKDDFTNKDPHPMNDDFTDKNPNSRFKGDKYLSGDDEGKDNKLSNSETNSLLHEDNDYPKYGYWNEEPPKSRQNVVDSVPKHERNDRKNTTPGESFASNETVHGSKKHPIPVIVEPDDDPPKLRQIPKADKNTLDAVHEEHEVKEPRYTRRAAPLEEPIERPAYTRRPSPRSYTPEYRSRENSFRDYRRRSPVPSPVESARNGIKPYRVTDPTRILSPPHGVDHERVTTPYQILRDPLERQMTTWPMGTSQ